MSREEKVWLMSQRAIKALEKNSKNMNLKICFSICKKNTRLQYELYKGLHISKGAEAAALGASYQKETKEGDKRFRE